MARRVDIRKGADCTPQERETFVNLVLQGGEVPENTLRRNVQVARALAFLSEDETLCAVGALKVPMQGYRDNIIKKSGSDIPEDAFPFELGYVFIVPAARGKKLSGMLVEALIGEADGVGVFATSRANNAAMHRALERCAFEISGKAYASVDDPNRMLQLFVKSGT